jgi:hypothetical protein
MDAVTRQNIGRCRALNDFGYDLDAAERLWDEAVRLPGAKDRPAARWYHGDLTAENLLVRDGRLAAVLDFGGLSVGDPAVDLAVAWEVLDPPAREIFRRKLGVDDATWLRGRAWASCALNSGTKPRPPRHVRSCPAAEQVPARPDLYAAVRRDHKWRGQAEQLGGSARIDRDVD